MWWTIGKRILRVFVVLWMAAVGGILGANLLALIGAQFFVPENQGADVRSWSHAGWYIGTLLFFLGAVTGRLRLINGARQGVHSSPTAPASTTGTSGVSGSASPAPHKKPSGPLGFVLAGGLAGGVLGFLLGANLLVFWFSLAYSPFAPQRVVSSVEVVQEPRPGSVVQRSVLRSSHPVSLYLCLTPAAVGVFAGATAAGIIAWRYRGQTQRASIEPQADKP